MAFLFKSKKSVDKIQHTKEGSKSVIASPVLSQNSNIPTNDKSAGISATPGSSLNNSITSIQGAAHATPSPEQANGRRGMGPDQAQELPARNGNTTAISVMNSNPNTSLYPWSQLPLTYTTSLEGPFPRYGAAVNSVASKEGNIYLMGGLINSSTVKGDLWMVEAAGNLTCFPLTTTAEGPGPRVGHASLLVGNAFIVYGGDTKLEESDILDETLYLLNTSTRQWSRAVPAGPRPAGRYGHSLNILGSKIYVFGGQVDGYFMNDLVAFDLNLLQVPTNRWEILIRNSEDGGLPVGQVPTARTNHTIVTYNEKLYLFGGTNGFQWFNDVWCYDPIPNAWFSLDCIGYIPSPREGHAAAIVDDVMYIFGGRAEDGTDLGDLAAFRVTSRRWYTFQNMGPSPSPRSGHSMTAHGKQIIVLAGEPSNTSNEVSDLTIAYLLDTSKIRYPTDHINPPLSDRKPTGRQPSISDHKVQTSSGRGLISRDTSISDSRRTNGIVGSNSVQIRSNENDNNGSMSASIPQSASTSHGQPGNPKFPRASTAQGHSGPPPQEPAPTPRLSSATPNSGRNRTQARYELGHSASVDITGGSGLDSFSTSLPENSSTSSSSKENPRETPTDVNSKAQNQKSSVNKSTEQENNHPPSVRDNGSMSMRSTSKSKVNRQQPSIDSASEQSSMRSFRPSSPPPANRQINNPLIRKSSRNSQTVSLLKELDVAKSRNAWYASELELARKAGYTPSSSFDQSSLDSFDDEDKTLIEALIAMKTELVNVQGSIKQQAVLAAKKIAEIENQRDCAVREAVFAKAKLAASNSSHTSTPSPDDESTDLANLASSRSADMCKKLAAALADQSMLQTKIETLNTELKAEQRSRKLAEEIATFSQDRLSELVAYKQRSSVETENLKAELYELSVTSRKEATQYAEAATSLQLLQVQKNELEMKYEKAETASQQDQKTFQTLREIIQSSEETQKALQKKLDEYRAEKEMIESKLIQLQIEHEKCKIELEIALRKLHDAEELEKSYTNELKSNWESVKTALDLILSRDMDTSSHPNDQKITLLQTQMENTNILARNFQAEADSASEKLRTAEERIAGLETYQEQASREEMSIRKQLQNSINEIQSLQAANTELKHQIESQQLETNAVSVQHNTLKDILEERNIRTTNSPRENRISTPTSILNASELPHVRELERKLAASIQAHEETKQMLDAREQDFDRAYREKLSQLDNDYQAAVKYVKGSEKMLKRLNDELAKYKVENIRLKDQVHEAEKKVSEIHGPTGWEEERLELQSKNESLQDEIKTSVKQLEQKIGDLRRELLSTEQERDEIRHDQAETQRRAQTDVAHLRKENALLQQRVQDAEQKVSLLLDQVEQSVDIYRRQSRPADAGHNTSSASGEVYHRNILTTDSASDTSIEGCNRNSMALDSLASLVDSSRSEVMKRVVPRLKMGKVFGIGYVVNGMNGHNLLCSEGSKIEFDYRPPLPYFDN